MRSRHRRSHGKTSPVGKKIIYITSYRNAAIEVMKDYQHKGELVEMEREYDETGQMVYVVYIYPRGY